MKSREEWAAVQIWWKQKCSKIEGNFSCPNVNWMINLIALLIGRRQYDTNAHPIFHKLYLCILSVEDPGSIVSNSTVYQNRESFMDCMGVIRTDGRLQDGYKPFQLIWITNGTRPGQDHGLVLCSAPSVPQPVFTITETAPTRAFSWLKAPTSAFTFKTLLRHYAKRALTPR